MRPIVFFLLTILLSTGIQAAVVFDWAEVGDIGNAADSSGYGAVNYEYQIATTEVSLAQYTEFLNAKAKTDLYGLYNTSMASNGSIAGISRSGASGSYVYSVIGSEDRPVTYVSVYDAMRFVNWLHNGQGDGSTETGAYIISTGSVTSASRTGNVATVIMSAATGLSVGDQVTVSGVSNSEFNGTFVVTGVSGSTFTYTTGGAGAASGSGGSLTGASASHTAQAEFWIPTEDEWYKAAYYDPTKGGSGGYWLYPTQSSTLAGNAIGVANSANYVMAYNDEEYFAKEINDLPSYLTDAGAYGSNSTSYYGTLDQGGNVWEWNETLVEDSSRGLRGGSWDDGDQYLRSSYRYSNAPSHEFDNKGFRVASVPEPSVGALMIVAGVVLLRRRYGKKK